MPTLQYDGLITIATGSSRRSASWKTKEMLWSEFVDKLGRVTRTQETQQEYFRMPKEERDNAKDVGGFVGGTLKGGRRKIDAVLQRRLITLDMDSITAGEDPWPTVVLILGCAAVLYSTHSHTAKAPRLRLVLPLSRPVSPEEYEAIARRIAGDIGIDMCDDTTYEPHRLMYWASASSDGEFRYEVQDGRGWMLTSSSRGTRTGKTRLSGLYQAGSPARFGVSLTSRETRPRKTVSLVHFAVRTPLRTQSRPSCLTSTSRAKTVAIPTRAARPPVVSLFMRMVALRTAITAQTQLAVSSATHLTSSAFTCSVRTTKGNPRTPRRTTFLPIRICVSGLRPTARAL